MKKGVLIAIAIVLLLFIGGIAVIYSSIGSVISDTIAQKGSAVTQTSVTVGASEFSTTSGLATLTNVQVSNPAGFSTKLALNVDQVDLWIDPETLTSAAIRVKSLILQAPEVTYEIVDNTDNLRTLKKQIETTLKSGLNSAPEKKLLIDRLQLKNGIVFVSSPDFSGAKRTATLGTITLNNVGSAQGGITAAELAHLLTLEILRETTIAALNTDLPLSDQARNILNGARDETKNAIKLFKDLLK
jgi:hypothetical protein